CWLQLLAHCTFPGARLRGDAGAQRLRAVVADRRSLCRILARTVLDGTVIGTTTSLVRPGLGCATTGHKSVYRLDLPPRCPGIVGPDQHRVVAGVDHRGVDRRASPGTHT